MGGEEISRDRFTYERKARGDKKCPLITAGNLPPEMQQRIIADSPRKINNNKFVQIPRLPSLRTTTVASAGEMLIAAAPSNTAGYHHLALQLLRENLLTSYNNWKIISRQ